MRGAIVRRSGWHRGRDWRAALLFLLPSLVGLGAFVIVPILWSLQLSFTNRKLVGATDWVGLANYARLFTKDPTFGNVLRNTLLFTAEYLVLNLVLAIALATWISSLKIGKTFARVALFLPTFTPVIAVSLVWALIFQPGGTIDYLVGLLGLGWPNFLLSPKFALHAVIIVTLWGNIGYNVILFNAALDLVPKNYLEAAQIDGAGAWTRFWQIRLPLISPTIFFGTVMTAISSLQIFDQIYVLTKGGPGDATETLGFSIFRRGFVTFDLGYASATAWVLFLIILALTVLQLWFQKKWVHYEG